MWKCYSVLYVFLILEVFSSTVGKVWKLMKPTEISFNLLHSLSSNLRSCNFFYNKHLYWKEKKIQTVWLHCLWSKQRLTTAALLIFIPVASNLPVCVTGFQITCHLQMYICEWVLTLAPLECVCTCGWGCLCDRE